MHKVLVTGGSGQLGSELKFLSKNFSEIDFTFIDINELDLLNFESVDTFFENKKFDFIINCAAYTAVDNAEHDQHAAQLINAKVPEKLAIISANQNATLIHISTDFVFEGRMAEPLKESDPTRPINIYGQTKLKGEKLVASATNDYFIIRTSWLYSSFGKNFVKTILRLAAEREELGVISDQIGTPTYARDLAQVIIKIIQTNSQSFGIYHFSNEGVASWYDFAHSIVEQAKLECTVKPIPTSAYPTPAKRPQFSLMDKSHIKRTFDIQISHWRIALKKFFKALDET